MKMSWEGTFLLDSLLPQKFQRHQEISDVAVDFWKFTFEMKPSHDSLKFHCDDAIGCKPYDS